MPNDDTCWDGAAASSGLSWSGFNLRGDRKSIDEAKRLLHRDERCREMDKIAVEQRDRIAELEARVATLQALCAEVYQVVCALSTLLPGEHEPTTRVLDNLSAAASDEPLPHAEVWPYVLPEPVAPAGPVMPATPSEMVLSAGQPDWGW